MTRKPVVAGQFYEGNSDKLKEQIKECFLSEFGPGSLPKGNKKGFVKGAIVSHAGYMFSGAAAAFVYKEIAETEKPDVFLVLGTNHTGLGRTSVLLDDFETPLGIAKVDREFGKALARNCKVENSAAVHLEEHSIEVQLPFLQFLFKDFKFVPLIVSSFPYIEQLADGIRKTVEESKKKVCIIASSDFTHYGFNYGYVPFENDVKENLKKLDYGAIEFIKKFDADGFLAYINKTGATICGYLPIAVMLKTIGKGSVKLLKYYTSADIIGGYGSSVSYAALVVE